MTNRFSFPLRSYCKVVIVTVGSYSHFIKHGVLSQYVEFLYDSKLPLIGERCRFNCRRRRKSLLWLQQEGKKKKISQVKRMQLVAAVTFLWLRKPPKVAFECLWAQLNIWAGIFVMWLLSLNQKKCLNNLLSRSKHGL